MKTMSLILTAIFILPVLGLIEAVQPVGEPANWISFIEDKRRDFIRRHKPIGTIRREEVRSHFAVKSLYEPGANLPRSFDFNREELQKLLTFEETCETKPIFKNQALTKAANLAEKTCKSSAIDIDFFKRGPLFHPLGHSFAFLARNSGLAIKTKNLSKYMHIMEVLKTPSILNDLGETFVYLLNLNQAQLKHFMSDDPIFVSRRYIFIRAEKEYAHYQVFEKSDWTKHFNQNAVTIFYDDFSRHCSFSHNSVCYYISPEIDWASGIPWGLGILLSILSLVYLSIKKSNRLKQAIDKEKEIILANLSHELRTPITAMLLELENLAGDDEVKQRFRSQLARLSQLSERSHNIIKFAKLKDAANYQTSRKELINELSEYEHIANIDIHLTQEDFQIRGAKEYIAMALKNVVDNAVKHGAKPISIIIRDLEESVRIEVVDQGDITESLTKNHGEAFFKQSSEKGMGLGLQIVATIMKHFDGQFRIDANPTRMTLDFKVCP